MVLVGVVGVAASADLLGFSAPDLALTQLSVGFIVSTVLLLMGLALLPQTSPKGNPLTAGKSLHGLLALASGAAGRSSWLVLTGP